MQSGISRGLRALLGLRRGAASIRCSDERSTVALAHAEPSAVLWRGQDPVSFSVMLSALDEEGIFYKEFQRRDYAAALSQPFCAWLLWIAPLGSTRLR